MRTTISIVTGLIAGVLIGVHWSHPQPSVASSAALLREPADEPMRLDDIVERIASDYVDELDRDALTQAAIEGVVARLDRYSAYLQPDELAELQASALGAYPGIGVELLAQRGRVTVVRALPQAPAWRAGIRAGDVIVAVDARAVGADAGATMKRLRGQEGSEVRLSLQRSDAAAQVDVVLRRERIAINSVTWAELPGRRGYLRIARFTGRTAAELRQALQAFEARSRGKLAGLIVDLRDNPGGLLDAAVEVADLFLDSGIIVSADGRASDARFSMIATPGELGDTVPLAVLVNGGSASAAEVLAGALQDHGRALLVGEPTFGKAHVQTVIPLASGHGLKLTTSRYFTPSGRSLAGHGLIPDVIVGDEQALARAQALLEELAARKTLTQEIHAWN